jgi:hypothetical protein
MLGLALAGCPSRLPGRPSLEITQVPASDPGGPGRLDFIEGKASGTMPGQQVVLYVHSGSWWVQPFANQPFTKIQADGSWKNSTHLGTEYAALLVNADYHPTPKLASLPSQGDGIRAVTVAKGKTGKTVVEKVIHFSGYDWNVRSAGSDRGGETNPYDPANAWTDDKGYLHLRIRASEGEWSCAEVSLNRSLGYGSYRFVVQDVSHMDPAAVLGMFTWDEASVEDARKELDIEISRWGKAASKNAQYVVQPFYVVGNLARFSAPPGELTHLLRWQPGSASFKTIRGNEKSGAGSKVVSERVFTSGVPVAAGENVHIDLYAYHHTKEPLQHEAEVIIENFEYLP